MKRMAVDSRLYSCCSRTATDHAAITMNAANAMTNINVRRTFPPVTP
jgi:hypothetical protein